MAYTHPVAAATQCAHAGPAALLRCHALSSRRSVTRQPCPTSGPTGPSSCTQSPWSMGSRRDRVSAAASSSGDSHAGHAFLHDFCMAIPYGAIAIVAGVVLFALGATQVAAPVAVGGLAVAGSAVLSLKNWKDNQQSTPYTLLAAGTSSYLAYTCWGAVQAGVVRWLTGTIAALSAALALFCVYNVLAGGNPPKRK